MDDYFGFVPIEEEWDLVEYRISPVDEFRRIVDDTLDDSYESEGFYYPPPARIVTCSSKGGEQVRPRSRHVAFPYPVPATHRIKHTGPQASISAAEWRKGEGGFLIHALGFLLRLRCQFHDWWFDSRLPIRTVPICVMTNRDISRLLAMMLTSYRTWTPEVRVRFANALFLKSRNLAYQWTWERFSAEYTVFDALYRCATGLRLVTAAGGHGAHFKDLGVKGLICWDPPHEVETGLFVHFRNNLIHEGLWVSGSPTSNAYSDGYRTLSQLNDRLALAVAGVDCSFTQSCWLTMTNFTLGLRK